MEKTTITQRIFYIIAMLTLLFMLQGCAGVRNSYESLLEKKADEPLIVLAVGDTYEVLAVGDGFPGWWGYYPSIAAHDPAVASIVCKKGRGVIPFREPGIIFGGERCYLQAHKTGVTWILPGNKYTLPGDIEDPLFMHVPEETDPLSVRPEGSITVTVVAASEH